MELVENYQQLNTMDELQKWEDKANKAIEALEKEEKLRKELEALNAKLLEEKSNLLGSLAGEKGSLQETQERAAKLQAQKADLEQQLHVSTFFITLNFFLYKEKVCGFKFKLQPI